MLLDRHWPQPNPHRRPTLNHKVFPEDPWLLRLPLPTDAEVAKASKRSALWHEYALWYRDVHDKMLEDDRHAGGDANKGKAIKGRRRESEYEIMRRAQPSNPSLAGLRRRVRAK